jgi:predicted amidophosphoribosyltransferase
MRRIHRHGMSARCVFCRSFVSLAKGRCGRCGARYSRDAGQTVPATERARAGRLGGARRAQALSPERRTEIARLAAEARWGRKEQP